MPAELWAVAGFLLIKEQDFKDGTSCALQIVRNQLQQKNITFGTGTHTFS